MKKNMKFINKIITFLGEVRIELKKVNWPNQEQILKYTLIVIVASVAVAIFLGGLDFLFTILLEKGIQRNF